MKKALKVFIFMMALGFICQLAFAGNVSIRMRNATIPSVSDQLLDGQNAVNETKGERIVDQTAAVPSSASQSYITVKGKVKDTDGMIVVGAVVIEQGTQNATITNQNGEYTIKTLDDATLEFSSIGYKTLVIPVDGKNIINAIMELEIEELNSVVVTAMGIVRNTRTLSYSTQSVRGQELTMARGTSGNLLDELKGKIAGATINTTSQIGGSSRIVLRGVKSVGGGANALIVVDGVPVQNPSTGEIGDVKDSYMGSDGMLDINSDDILSVDVMKGPSAAALYGSQAANGAIIITTKSGQAGQYEVEYNGSVSLDVPVYLMKMQNTYGRGNGGILADGAGESWGGNAKCTKNNFKEPFKNGATINNSFSFKGGNDKVQNFTSYTNNHSIGNIDHNFMNKHTFDARLNSNLLKNLYTDAKLTYTKSKINNMPMIGDTGLGTDSYIMPRDLTIAELNDYEDIDELTGQPIRKYWTISSIFDNPLWVINRTRRNQYRDRMILMGSVRYQILPWLSIQGRYSYDKYNNKLTYQYYGGSVAYNEQVNGYYFESSNESTSENMDILVSGENNFLDDFKVTYNLGASRKINKYNSESLEPTRLLKKNVFNLKNAEDINTYVDWGKTELQSVYGTAQLSWKDMIYLDVTGREDWSSTLPSPYNYFYPSVGLTGILSDLIKMPEWVSFGKIRASWAKVGSPASPYMLEERYTYDNIHQWTNISTTKMRKDLKPEMTRSWEIGTEWKFLDSRLGFDFTYYNSSTKNQFISVPMPMWEGYNNEYVNCGKVDNKGIELILFAIPVQTGDWYWSTRVNLAHNKNELVELYPGKNTYQIGGSDRFASVWSVVGEQIGQMRGQTWKKNDKGQYVVDDKGLPVLTDYSSELGNYNPKLTLGWNNTIKYKRFTLNLLFDGRIGGVMMSGTDAILAFYGVGDFTKAHRDGGWVLDAVKEDGTKNTTAIDSEAFWKKVSGGRTGAAGFFMFNATNFRLRQLSLGYNVPLKDNKIFKSINVSITGHNLLILYRGKNKLHISGLDDRKIPIDPDQSVSAGSFQGEEMGILPSTRSFGINLNLKF